MLLATHHASARCQPFGPAFRSCFAHALVKTVKLWERPTPHELLKQLEVVFSKLPDIYSSGTALNIWMERDQKGVPPEAA